MRKSTLVILVMIILSFIIGAWLYPSLPEQMPSHWNMRGEVDSYMPKILGVLLMPLISVGLLLLFLAIPRIDPLKKNIKKFQNTYEGLVVLIIAFLFYINILVLAWSSGVSFNMTQMIIPAIGLLFIYIGSIMGKLKRNWFIGIKTPWTLSSDRVWDKTHRIGGKVFIISGIISLFGLVLPDYALWLLLAPVLIGVVYTVVYSYFEYQKGK